MKVDSLRSFLGGCVLLASLAAFELTVAPGVAAQEAAPADALSLTCDTSTAGMSADALRTAIERELQLPVKLVDPADAQGTFLAISATTQAAVNLTFVRADGSKIERTVDVSSSSGHADETLALVAANLMRDEAADLLAALRAARPLPPPAAAAKPEPPPPPPVPKGCEPNKLRKVSLGLDVLPYVGMSSGDRTDVERKFSFNLFGGVTGAVRGFELGGFLNLDDHSVCGLQISGIANLVNGPVQGVQLGMVNWSNGRVDGAQFGLVAGALGTMQGAQYGLVEIAGGAITGAQFGLVNIGGDSLTGAQFGLGNLAATSIKGGQFGLVNVGGDTLTGTQMGLANVTTQRAVGAQLGLANISGRDVTGLQLGLANVSAGRVHGAMIGLFNTAEDADAAIGLVNVLWKGRAHLDVWGTDFGVLAVGVEHGGRYLHNIYGFGVTRRNDGVVFSPVFGLGGRLVQTRKWTVDLDLVAYWLLQYNKPQDNLDYSFVGSLRVPIAYRFTPAFALFVSPALNVSAAGTRDNSLVDPSLLGGARLTEAGANTLVRLWPGFTAGVRFF
jgi:uncharacterized protein YjbI with pentapeptide repeats